MNRFTKLLAGVVGGYITVVMLSGCSEKPGIDEQGMAITLTHGDVEAEVSEIAFLIATATQDQRDSAVHLIAGSDLREHKYRLDSLLKQALNYNWNPAHEENRDLYIYFPVPEHLTKALAGQEFIVTWQPPVDDKTLDSIAAYTLQGDPIWIDAWNAPQTPVMVITYEKPRRQMRPSGYSSNEPGPDYTPFSEIGGEDKMEIMKGVGGGGVPVHRITARAMKLFVSPEPWWLGALEIYTMTDIVPYYEDHAQREDFEEVDYRYILYVFDCGEHHMYGDVLGTSTTYETHILEDDHFYNDWGDPDDTVQFFTIYEGGSNVCTGPSHYLGDNANLDIYFELQ